MSDKEWLLIKRGLYYRPDNCGYTGIKDQAGRYSLEEMHEAIKGEGVTAIHEAGAPEFTTACFDDLAREHLTKQRDEARARIETLEAALKAALLFHQRQPFEYRHDEQIEAIQVALGHQQLKDASK